MSNSVRAETDAVAMQRAERFQVTQGKAKVYLVGGKLGFGGPFDPTIPGAELMVNNVGVVKVGKNEVAVVDLPPGRYVFSWNDINNEGKQETLTKQLNSGDILILRAETRMGAGGLIFGPLGASATNRITEINDRSAVGDKRLVIANDCPESICGKKANPEIADKPLNTNSTLAMPAAVVPQESKPAIGPTTQQILSPNIEPLEVKCRQLGFTPGTEKFGDCVMRLLK